MTTSESPTSTVPARSFVKRAGLFLVRWTYRLVGLAVIVSALVIAFAQTQIFRDWLRTYALGALNDALDGKVACSDIRIDIFRGIVLDRPQLYANGTTVLDAAELRVSYDLAPLSRSVIAVNEVRLLRPRIFVVRTPRDSVWNVSRIAKPSTDTTTSAPPDIFIALRRFEIVDGTLLVNDATVPWPDGKHFDPMHLHVRDLQLRLSAYAALKDEDISLAIDRLSYRDLSSPFVLQDFALAVHVTRTGIDIPMLQIRLPQTDVSVRAAMQDVNIFDGFTDSTLRKHPVVGQVTTERIQGADLAFFLPDIVLLDSYGMTANVTYSGQAVRVKNLALTAGDARINGDVLVDHLDGAKPLALDIKLDRSTARYADIRRRLRFVPLPDLPFLGTAKMDHVHLRGEPSDSLWFEVHGEDRPGRVDGAMTLYLNKPTLGYQVDMNIRRGQLGVFLPADSTISTDLNGRVMMVGSGTTLTDLKATTQVELDVSTILGRTVRSARTIIHADGEGELRIDTMIVNLTPFKRDSLDSILDIGNRQQMAASGTMHLGDLTHPRYALNVATEGLDLASLFRDPSLPSRMTAVLDIDGEGFELDSMMGRVAMRMNEFALDDRALLPFSATVDLQRDGDQRSFAMRSAIADVDVKGRFLPTTLISAISETITTVADVVMDRARHIVDRTVEVRRAEPLKSPVDVTVSADIRDASIFNAFIPDMSVTFTGVVRGRLAAGIDTVMLDMDTVDVVDLGIQAEGLNISSDPASLRTRVRLADLTVRPRVAELSVTGTCDSVLYVNDLMLRHPFVEVRLVGDTGDVRISTGINAMQTSLGARLAFSEGSSVMHVDSASFVLDRDAGLEWRTVRAADVTVINGVYSVQGLSFQRAWGETVSVNGSFSPTVFRDTKIDIDNFPMRDISRFVALPQGHPVRLLQGLVNKATISLTGSWEEPLIDVVMDATNVAYNQEVIGTLHTELRHAGRNVSGKATIVNPSLKQKVEALVLDVNAVPLDLGLKNVESRWVDGRPIDIRLVANKLSLAAAEPFLPAIERVRGAADAVITVEGTVPNDVKFGGSARFNNISFVAAPTNVSYRADGVLRLEGSELIFDTLVVRNVSRDMPGGIANATGTVWFDGLSVDRMDFTVRTPGIVVLNMQSQATSPDVYGDLRIASGSNPIRLHGSLNAPKLEGDINVLYGDIIFPKERSTTKRRYTSADYLSADDVARQKYGSIVDYVRPATRVPVDTVQDDTSSTVLTTKNVQDVVDRSVRAVSGSFADILEYDLNISLNGRMLLTMVLGITEILIADLELADSRRPLTFTGSFGTATNLRGKVRVKEGTSTYKFFKSFAVSGILSFDEGGMTNPALDLLAVYQDSRYTDKSQGGVSRETFRVEIVITGTKERPNTKFRVYRNDRQVTGDSAKIAGDAIMLILVGRTQDELFANGQGNLVSEVNASMSAVATSALGDILSGVGGIVQNAQVDLGSDISQSRLTLSGQLFGNVSYRVSGAIADFSGNSTFTVTVPLSVFGDAEALKFFMLDFSRSVNQTGNITRQQRDWEIKIGARLP